MRRASKSIPSSTSRSTIRINDDYLKEGLLIPHIDKRLFKKEELFALTIDDRIIADVDLMPKVDVEDSLKKGYGIEAESEFPNRFINPAHIDALNWNRIYFALLETRIQKNWYNFVFGENELKEIIRKKLYRLKCQEDFITPKQCKDLPLVEDITIAILRKYLQKYFDKKRNLWVKNNLDIRVLDKNHGNFDFTYHIRVSEKEQALIEAIEKLIKNDIEKLYKGDKNLNLVNIFFDRNLYQPLLARYGDALKVEIHPEGLNTGERKFVHRPQIPHREPSPILSQERRYLSCGTFQNGVSGSSRMSISSLTSSSGSCMEMCSISSSWIPKALST